MSAHGTLLASGRDLVLGYRARGKTFPVVEGLSFEIRAGELICLIGPNGAGKSTFLRTLSGNLRPLSGEILLGDKEPWKLPPAELAARLALVLNERPSQGGILVEELVSLGRLPHADFLGRLSADDHRAVEDALRETDIASLRARSYERLSDGERSRVHAARALAQDAPLVLMDEPTAHLDWPHRIALATLLRRIARARNRGVLLSTHELDLAMQLADKWIVLAKGGAPACAAPEEIALRGHFEAAFGCDGFHLDPSAGQIRLDRRGERPVRVSGTGPARQWTERALERMGWKPGDQGPAVGVSNDGGNLRWHVRDREYDRLDAFLHDLAVHADDHTVSELGCAKHAFQAGIRGTKGGKP